MWRGVPRLKLNPVEICGGSGNPDLHPYTSQGVVQCACVQQVCVPRVGPRARNSGTVLLVSEKKEKNGTLESAIGRKERRQGGQACACASGV